ncbi:MAG TPA: hypothetical protein PKC28_15985, partial [Bdellovibrionales bacterium]|nr:hypothetical protein [Bdellovibrionales bacterium]
AIDFDRPWDPAGVEVTSPAILAERERNAAHQAAKAAEKAAKKNTERDEAQAKAAAQELKEDWN